MTERNGGELVAKVLKAHGVKFVFTLVGGHISPLLVESKKSGIRIIDVRHEVTAVFAADAVARLSGVPGVAAVTAGPGVTNTLTAIKNAQMAQSPLVLIGGAAATLLKGRGSLQDIDQMVLMRPVCKFCASVTRVKDIVPTLRRAFAEAASGVPGPCFVELPIDVLYSIAEISANMGLLERKRARDIGPENLNRVWVPEEATAQGLSVAQFVKTKKPAAPIFLSTDKDLGLVVGNYLKFARWKLFAGAWEPADASPLPVVWPSVPHSAVKKTVAALTRASRPVVVVGSQALLRGPVYADRLKIALEKIGVPCFLGGMARGLLPITGDSLYVRQGRTKALREADVVLLCGVMVDFRLNYGRALSKKSYIVAANRSKEDLTKNSDMFWSPKVAALCDPCDFIFSVEEAMRKVSLPAAVKTSRASWHQKLKKAEAARDASNLKTSQVDAVGHGTQQGKQLLNPLALCIEADKQLGDIAPAKSAEVPSVLVGDGGDFVACVAYTTKPRGPLAWLDPGPFGTLGVGGGFALGAKLCRPNADVWLFWGDGSAGYSIAEFDTFKRHGVPIIAVIGNDACWTQIEREQVPSLGDNVACPLEYTPYEIVAEGYGGKGIHIGAPGTTSEDVRKALKEAVTISRKLKVPVCVNALIGSTNFREGSISV